jgi:hypothetical protein
MLRQLHDSLWVADLPLRMPGGVDFGTRTTLVRLADGSLFAHSPGPLDDELAGEMGKLGDVRHLVASNLFHNLFVKDWMSRYEGATLYAPPTFETKIADVPFETLTDAAPPAWSGQLEQTMLQGAPRLNEIFFFHPPSRTLMLTDLCFNFHGDHPLLTRLFLRVAGAYDRFGASRLARLMMFQDKAAVRASVDRLLALDFDRIIVTHGDVLESGGQEALRKAFAEIG